VSAAPLAGGLAVAALPHASIGWAVGISVLIAASAIAAVRARHAKRPALGAERRVVNLSGYLGRAEKAQCPCCGSFRLDGRMAGAAWQFRCLECDDQWAWLPGNPWPPVQLRSRLRR